MNKQKIAQVLFWIGIAGVIINFISVWIQNQITRANTPETLIGTGWAYGEAYSSLGGLALLIGFTFSLLGVLLYSSQKGSYFWLWALVPVIGMNIGLSWSPTTHIPSIFGLGAAIITLSYLGLLWSWIKENSTGEGLPNKGKQIQLLGYSFLFITALFLCNYIGNPMNPSTEGFPAVSSYSVLITMMISFALLSIGNYLSLKQSE